MEQTPPPADPDPVLAEVEAFLAATGMGVNAFGRDALGDPAFVRELRKGRELRRSTRLRVRTFIAKYRTDAEAAA